MKKTNEEIDKEDDVIGDDEESGDEDEEHLVQHTMVYIYVCAFIHLIFTSEKGGWFCFQEATANLIRSNPRLNIDNQAFPVSRLS